MTQLLWSCWEFRVNIRIHISWSLFYFMWLLLFLVGSFYRKTGWVFVTITHDHLDTDQLKVNRWSFIRDPAVGCLPTCHITTSQQHCAELFIPYRTSQWVKHMYCRYSAGYWYYMHQQTKRLRAQPCINAAVCPSASGTWLSNSVANLALHGSWTWGHTAAAQPRPHWDQALATSAASCTSVSLPRCRLVSLPDVCAASHASGEKTGTEGVRVQRHWIS